MNLFNRILIVVELVLIILGSLGLIALLLLNRTVIQPTFDQVLALLSAQSLNAAHAVLIGVLTLIVAFAVLLLLLEFQPSSGRRLRIQSTQGIEVLMTADAITQQLEYTLDALTNVLRVRPRVSAVGKDEALDVFIEMWTTTDVDVKTKTEEAAGVARQVIEDKLGLKVGRVQIKLDQMKAPPKRSPAPAKSGGNEVKV